MIFFLRVFKGFLLLLLFSLWYEMSIITFSEIPENKNQMLIIPRGTFLLLKYQVVLVIFFFHLIHSYIMMSCVFSGSSPVLLAGELK